ncbi:MAG TPA: PEGA domain-containing protein [Pyrinomonadaceae bacterium]|nr:PEGA domain-containing protein [Pyrinomonadaceae bacterium]
MRKPLVALCVIFAILGVNNFNLCRAQTESQNVVTENVPKTPWILAEDTPVRLRLMQTLSSGTNKLNDKVDFEVIEDVKVNNTTIISQGATAIATVTQASSKKSFGRSGKLNVNIDHVRLANGEKAALRAVKGGSGGSRKAVMTTAVVATAIVFFPAAPLFFFIKGKNIIIPKGTEITAFVAADIPLTESQFKANENPATASLASSETVGESSKLATIVVKSTPDASEISVNGKFLGSTTSTLRLTPGEHVILIEKPGFRPWQRTISIGDNAEVTIDATLEKLP